MKNKKHDPIAKAGEGNRNKKFHEPTFGRIERRTFPGTVEIRSEGEQAEGESKQSRTIEGTAAVFNTTTDLGWWEERISPGAFSKVLDNDVRALFNHDPNLILARSSNSLEIWEDSTGLKYRFEVPNTTAGNDLLENVRNGNITQSSFGFSLGPEDYEIETREDGSDLITINSVSRLHDVSPVTFPAYETTEVTARSIDKIKSVEIEEKRDEAEAEIIEETIEIEAPTGFKIEYIEKRMLDMTPPELI